MRLSALCLLLALCAPVAARSQIHAPPVPRDRLGPAAVLWSARSCIGEAGWYAWRGECAAILWVYESRLRAMEGRRPGLTFSRVVREYSSAVKRGPHHQRPWIFGLRLSYGRPRGWPLVLSWPRYREHWQRTVASVRRFFAGLEPNPCPGARHYGNRTTDGRPSGHRRARCSIPTQNLFWSR